MTESKLTISWEKEGHIFCDFWFSSSFQKIDMILLTRPEGCLIGLIIFILSLSFLLGSVLVPGTLARRPSILLHRKRDFITGDVLVSQPDLRSTLARTRWNWKVLRGTYPVKHFSGLERLQLS